MDTIQPQPLAIELDQEIEQELPEELEQSPEPTLRVVHLLFIGIVLLLAILRFSNVDRFPLSPLEAENALAVWLYWQPPAPENAPFLQPNSPAYFSLTALTSQLFGYATWSMRLIPILASIASLLLLWIFRAEFGWYTVLTVGLLMAVSPTFLFMSREASGNSLAIMALIGALGFWVQYRSDWRLESLLWSVGFVAFGITTAPLFLSGLLILGITFLFERLIGPPLQAPPIHYNDEGNPESGPLVPQAYYRPAGVTALIVFLSSAALFLWNLPGLGYTFDLFSTWISQFGGFLDSTALLDSIFALGRYELIPFLAGAVIAAWGTWQNERRITFHAYWFASAMLLMFAQGSIVENVFLLALPSYFIIGQALQNVSEAHAVAEVDDALSSSGQPVLTLPLVGAGVALLVIGAVNFGRFARQAGPGLPFENPYFFLALFCVIMFLFLIVSVYLYEPTSAAWGTLALLVVGITVFHWGIGWRLSHLNANDPRERWVNLATDQEIVLMENILREVGRDTLGLELALSIFSTVDHPVMRWYLKDFPDVRYGDVVPIGNAPDVVITLDGDDPSIGSDYTGTDFGFLLRDNENILSTRDSLRWWIFGDSPSVSIGDRIVLWVRADLINERLQ